MAQQKIRTRATMKKKSMAVEWRQCFRFPLFTWHWRDEMSRIGWLSLSLDWAPYQNFKSPSYYCRASPRPFVLQVLSRTLQAFKKVVKSSFHIALLYRASLNWAWAFELEPKTAPAFFTMWASLPKFRHSDIGKARQNKAKQLNLVFPITNLSALNQEIIFMAF